MKKKVMQKPNTLVLSKTFQDMPMKRAEVERLDALGNIPVVARLALLEEPAPVLVQKTFWQSLCGLEVLQAICLFSVTRLCPTKSV